MIDYKYPSKDELYKIIADTLSPEFKLVQLEHYNYQVLFGDIVVISIGMASYMSIQSCFKDDYVSTFDDDGVTTMVSDPARADVRLSIKRVLENFVKGFEPHVFCICHRFLETINQPNKDKEK